MGETNREIHCSSCGAAILQRTASKTGGLCMPCHTGTRDQIEAGKRWAAERREADRINCQAAARISSLRSVTLGEFLMEQDPIGVLWPFLVRRVYPDHSGTSHVDELAAPAKVIYLANIFDGEVINGGVTQFFSNSSGDFAHQSLHALLELGAVVAADILRRGMGTFPNGIVPTDRQERCALLFPHEEQNRQFWNDLDEEYYLSIGLRSQTSVEDLASLILRYMRNYTGSGLAA
jgi:Domain of unknown function (DUF4375)